jgi:phosphotriesterase-related protein
MEVAEYKGKAQTVLGLVDGKDLGVTLPHEHMFIDIRCYIAEPDDPEGKKLARQKITLENLWFSRHHMFSSEDNMVLEDEDTAIREAENFKKVGGKTIVDVTPIGISRNPAGLKKVAEATGINIIMGTSYYVALSFAAEMGLDKKTEQEIADEFIREIREGVGDTGIKAGIIAEIGCSWPMDEGEKKVLRAAGLAQRETGAAISIHPGAREEAPLVHIKMLKEVGADISRVVIGHMTRTFPPEAWKARTKLAEKGCYLEFDWFGREGGLPTSLIGGYDRVTDQTRIYQIMDLIKKGFLEQILISHDVCFKFMQQSYGGSGFRYIPEIAVPEMRKKGMNDEQINTILVENPKRVLTFV